MFATRDLSPGTRILAEYPLILIPMAQYYRADIEAAFATMTAQNRKKYFSLASNHGQDPKAWPPAIHPHLSSDEKRRIEEQHSARIGNEASLISIFQTNCMQNNDGAAIFYDCSRINHSCLPNAFFAWNNNIAQQTIHAISMIKEGEEVTISYVDPFHNKVARAWELHHYGFSCRCRACGDDLNNDDKFAGESCERRFRLRALSEGQTVEFVGDAAWERQEKITRALEIAGLMREEGLFSQELGHA